MDDTEFRCLVPFPDESASFVNGFEAGMVWQRMVNGETPIENDCPYHSDNRVVLESMAAAQGYDAKFETCEGLEEWMTAIFTKRRVHLSVVKP